MQLKRIGYIGLGIMGRAMALNLLKAGFEVVVYNRSAPKMAPLTEAGAKRAKHPAELAAQVQAICINVTDTPDVEEVLFGKHGIVEGNPGDTADLVVIDHSTISPAATRRFAEQLATNGIEMLDAPVSGGDVGAQRGTLSVMIGGKPDVYTRCLSIFQAVGKTITYCGPSGSGQATKACNQILCAVNLLGVCEALALAHKEGLDLEKMLAVTTAGAGGSWSLANLGPQIARDDMSPGFMIDLINKDLAIVHDEAKNLGLPVPATHLASDLFRAAATNGFGQNGTQAVSRVYEIMAGLRYARKK